MNRPKACLSVVMVVLAACGTAREPEPSSVLTMQFPVISATSPTTMVRIDQDGRIQQAVRLANAEGWKVYSSSIREDRVSTLMTAIASVSPAQFREPENSPRFFTMTAEMSDGTIELSYNDATLPCGDDAFRRFQRAWESLNAWLPQSLPETELPRCSSP